MIDDLISRKAVMEGRVENGRDVNGMKRTYENCSLQKKLGEAGKDGDGTCMGFSRSEIDDEPCETCKKCKLYTGNDGEERYEDVRCSNCDYAKWSDYYESWACQHPRKILQPIFNGATHPKSCPIDPKGRYRKILKTTVDIESEI